MKNTSNPALQVDSNGKLYLYGTHLSCACVPRFTVKLAQEVDETAIETAVKDVLRRFPQMAVGVENDGNSYYYVPLDTPPPVFHNCGGTVRSMGTADTNGYLFCVSYNGKMLRFDFLYALCDGPGALVFIKAVLYRYLELLGLPVESDGTVRTCDEPFRAEEAEDPVLRLPEEEHAAYPRMPAFRIPEEGAPVDTVVQLRLPVSKLLGAAKQYEKKPATFICPLFSAALHEAYCRETEAEEPIVAAVQVNLRKYFPSETTRGFVVYAGIPYDRSMHGLRFEEMLEVEKGLLDFEKQAHHLACDARKAAREINERLEAGKTLKEKREIAGETIRAMAARNTYIMLDMGECTLPDCMRPHVREIHPCLPTATTPFTVALLTYGDELIVNIAQCTSDVSVCKQFVRTANRLGIPAHIHEVYPFHTMRYGV